MFGFSFFLKRRKWIHCFQDVQGVIFIVSISDYDQISLADDYQMNRMYEVKNDSSLFPLFFLLFPCAGVETFRCAL